MTDTINTKRDLVDALRRRGEELQQQSDDSARRDGSLMAQAAFEIRELMEYVSDLETRPSMDAWQAACVTIEQLRKQRDRDERLESLLLDDAVRFKVDKAAACVRRGIAAMQRALGGEEERRDENTEG